MINPVITKSDLRRLLRRGREAEVAIDRVKRIHAMLEHVSAPVAGMGASDLKPSDPLADGIAALDAAERRARNKVSEYVALWSSVENTLGGVANSNHRNILQLRYLDGLPWKQVAAKMHYSESWCKRLLAAGLKSLGIN